MYYAFNSATFILTTFSKKVCLSTTDYYIEKMRLAFYSNQILRYILENNPTGYAKWDTFKHDYPVGGLLMLLFYVLCYYDNRVFNQELKSTLLETVHSGERLLYKKKTVFFFTFNRKK